MKETFAQGWAERDDGLVTAFVADSLGALWDVRVLDAWADAHPTSDAYTSKKRPGARHCCSSRSHAKKYWGDSHDAARRAAAKAAWPELPESVRAELGPRPE